MSHRCCHHFSFRLTAANKNLTSDRRNLILARQHSLTPRVTQQPPCHPGEVVAVAGKVLQPERLIRHRDPREVRDRSVSVVPMEQVCRRPPVVAPCHPRLTASGVQSDPCEAQTEQTDRADENNGLPGQTTRMRSLPTTAALEVRRLLPRLRNPPGRRTTTSVCFLGFTSLTCIITR